MQCFDRILRNPPHPLSQMDIWFQIGHVFEQQKEVRSTCQPIFAPPASFVTLTPHVIL